VSAEVHSDAEAPQSPPSVDDDVAEFAGLLGMTVHDLKSVAVHDGEPDRSDDFRRAFEGSGLGRRHVRALLAVAAAEPVSVTDLAARLGLLLSTTSTIVGELSRAGLLERSEDERDRRRTLVRVHDEYRKTMAMRLRVAFAPVRRTFEALSAEERSAFMATWRLLNHEAARAADGPDA
jgi:DNA-binding MarR family transcriptional regulator